MQAREASAAEIKAYVASQKLKVLTFAGYSGAGYQDTDALQAHAKGVLRQYKPGAVIINIGATAEGVGAVYELAKQRGFRTMGIVSTLARDNKVPLSPCVDQVFFVKDSSWGGLLAGTTQLAPTSQAIVDNSWRLVAIGGGDVTRDEMLAARHAGKRVRFIAADMNHGAARDKAAQRGQPEPTDFRGSAHAALHRPR